MRDYYFDEGERLRCVLVEASGAHLMLPNSVIAELLTMRELTPAEDGSPDWLAGTIRWRFLDVPVIDLARLLGQGGSAGKTTGRRRILVCHSFDDREGVRFMGVIVDGLPQLVLLADGDVADAGEPGESGDEQPLAGTLVYRDTAYLVPDLLRIGAMTADAA